MIVACALIIDALLGEANWLYGKNAKRHPVVLMGVLIAWSEKKFNKGKHQKRNGFLCLTAFVVIAGSIGIFFSSLPDYGVIEALITFSLIAHKSLIEHLTSVKKALNNTLSDARFQLSKIVGRDVSALDEAGVSRAAIESGAENFSDGVVAPIFWALSAGLPGILIYKMVNTADSMIGYKTERFLNFGWAAAKADDILNYIPARLTAFLMLALKGNLHLFNNVKKEARKHRSPNAGWPEAALSLHFNIALSGPRMYNEVIEAHPFINEEGRHALNKGDIEKTCRFLWVNWGFILSLSLILGAITLFYIKL